MAGLALLREKIPAQARAMQAGSSMLFMFRSLGLGDLQAPFLAMLSGVLQLDFWIGLVRFVCVCSFWIVSASDRIIISWFLKKKLCSFIFVLLHSII